ncbi:hypothetical protein AVEN_123413-1, partial [Araneus ventricosus]
GRVPTSLGRFNRILTDKIEMELTQHCKDLDSMFYGLTLKHMKKVAFEYADVNGVAGSLIMRGNELVKNG